MHAEEEQEEARKLADDRRQWYEDRDMFLPRWEDLAPGAPCSEAAQPQTRSGKFYPLDSSYHASVMKMLIWFSICRAQKVHPTDSI